MHSFFKAPLALGLLAISSTPAFADPSGFLSIALGGGHRDQLGLTGDSPLFEGRGTIAVDIAPNWLLQADAVVHHRHYFSIKARAATISSILTCRALSTLLTGLPSSS